MGQLEVLFSGEREGKFLLYCISEVENGTYIVFTLETHSLMVPYTAPDRETAIQNAKQFFFDAGEQQESQGQPE